MRKTKIVCTLGPAIDDPEILTRVILEGMNVARINFSHGSYEEHKKRIDTLVEIRKDLDQPIALLLDTKGPEIRIRDFKDGKVELVEGQLFTLVAENILGDERRVSISYPLLSKDVSKNTRILIDDGLIELKVMDIKEGNIICEVLNGGALSNKKSVNVPNTPIKIEYLSKKDEQDIIFGIENNFDFIAASFTRSANDVLDIRKVLDKNGGKDIQIIAKIENSEGVNNIDDIIKVSDGIMVARGDMGVEIPLYDLPIIQKTLIKKCYKAGKKVITATQLLDSMIRNPRPTRAETTDIANAIYDGTSAIMLSGETAIGKYPVESVATMAKIAERTEQSIDYKKRFSNVTMSFETNVTNAIGHATCTTAHDLGVKAIIAVTRSGQTARMVSKFRPSAPIIAITPFDIIRRQLALSWGIIPILGQEEDNTDKLFEHAVDKALTTGIVSNGDLVVIAGGIPSGISGTTNILKVHLVGHVLISGVGVNNLHVSGQVCVSQSPEDALKTFSDGDILVINHTSNELMPILKMAKGIIVEEGDIHSHAAVVGLTLDIPVITGAHGATKILKSGAVVTMDGTKGLVYAGVKELL